MIRTIMLKRVGIPTEINDIINREVFSTELYREEKGKRNLTSYVIVTKKTSSKNIIVLATVEPLLGVMIDDKKQKSTITNNFTKGGVDIIDKKIEFYSAKTKCI